MISRICSYLTCCCPHPGEEENLVDDKTFNELEGDPSSLYYNPYHKKQRSSLPPEWIQPQEEEKS